MTSQIILQSRLNLYFVKALDKPFRISTAKCGSSFSEFTKRLDDWLTKVAASQIPELQSFVLGVERDKAAVLAGLTLPHSNGVVEGKVKKLKLIKRMGYGRAGFPLLRQRVLHAL